MIKTMRLLGVESLLLHIERGKLSYFGLLIRMPLSGGFLGMTPGSTQSTLGGYCSIWHGTPPEEAGRHGRWACYCNPDPDECEEKPSNHHIVIWIHLGRNSTSLAVSAVSQTFSSIHSFGVVFLSATGDWKLDVIPSRPACVGHYTKTHF